MPRSKALRDRLDLSAYPGIEVKELSRQRVILSYFDLEVDIRCQPRKGRWGAARIDSWFVEPHFVRRPAHGTTRLISTPTAQAVQDNLEKHLARVDPLVMLASAGPDDERMVTVPLVLRLPVATRTRLEKLADEVGMELDELVSDLIQRQHQDDGGA